MVMFKADRPCEVFLRQHKPQRYVSNYFPECLYGAQLSQHMHNAGTATLFDMIISNVLIGHDPK
jgi:hypothetical protein